MTDKKVAIVTGGHGGIGSAVVDALAVDGYSVVVADLETSTNAVNKSISAATTIATDVTDSAQVDAMVAQVLSDQGRIDLVVCNAGVVDRVDVEDMTDQQWDRTMNVNVTGVFKVCRAAIPALRASQGAIVNISSISGRTGFPQLAHYCASKFAVIGFTNALAKEVAPQVRVNAICPGILETAMWDYLKSSLWGDSGEAEFEQYVAETIPMQRPQEGRDIAAAVLFLASQPNITGQALGIDGGMGGP